MDAGTVLLQQASQNSLKISIRSISAHIILCMALDVTSECFDRKPNPGMLLRARDDRGICLLGSVMISDKEWDIVAAKAAGVADYRSEF